MANERVSDDEIRKVGDYLRAEASGWADSCRPGHGDAYMDGANLLDAQRNPAKVLELVKEDEEYASGQVSSYQARLARIQVHRVVLERLAAEANKVG